MVLILKHESNLLSLHLNYYIMYRKIDAQLLEWKNGIKRKPLVFSGARQVGKSYSVRTFGRQHFNKVVEINFERQRELHVVFEFNFDVVRIVNELEILLGIEIKSGENLLFFDEVQSCPSALQSLRYFYEEMPYIPLIAAGSLLDFEFRDIPFPVGRVQIINMYPMSFEEFIIASNKRLWEAIHSTKDISPHIEDKIYELLNDYFFVGGMPEAVKCYIDSKDYVKIQKIQENLLYGYERDFGKYQPNVNQDCLRDIMSSLPRYIGASIMYTKLSNEFSSVTVKKGVTVLSIAKLLYKVKNVSVAGLPLTTSGKQFKLIFVDIGLLCKLSGLTPSDRIANHKWSAHFKGFLAEQFVGQELLCKDYNPKYWARTEPGASSEVDYVITKDSNIIPIEVKAGTKGSLKSLHYLLHHNPHINQAIVYSNAHTGIDGKIKFEKMWKVGWE